MRSILHRELAAYFHSPIGYIFLAAFYFFAGTAFFNGNLLRRSADLGAVFSYLFNLVLFLIPMLTMRLLSEDRKNKTDQALLTAPISITAMVMGKFLAASLFFLLALSVTPVYALIIAAYTAPNWAAVCGTFVSTFLLGEALIAIGMFISSMTENQVVAAVGGFTAALFLLLVDMFSSVITHPAAVSVLNAISFHKRYNGFLLGVFELSGVLFFLSICAVFLFLTVWVFEKRRWS